MRKASDKVQIPRGPGGEYRRARAGGLSHVFNQSTATHEVLSSSPASQLLPSPLVRDEAWSSPGEVTLPRKSIENTAEFCLSNHPARHSFLCPSRSRHRRRCHARTRLPFALLLVPCNSTAFSIPADPEEAVIPRNEAGRRHSFLRGEPARVKTGPGLGACASPDRRPPAPQSHPPAPRLRDAVAPFQRGQGTEPVIKCAGPARAKLTRHSPPTSRRRPPGAKAEPRGSSPDALSRGAPRRADRGCFKRKTTPRGKRTTKMAAAKSGSRERGRGGSATAITRARRNATTRGRRPPTPSACSPRWAPMPAPAPTFAEAGRRPPAGAPIPHPRPREMAPGGWRGGGARAPDRRAPRSRRTPATQLDRKSVV